MSVRIYQLSKQTGLSNGELIELLKSRGYLVTSASSTIDNISAESLVEEFTKKPEPEAPKPAQPARPTISNAAPAATFPV